MATKLGGNVAGLIENIWAESFPDEVSTPISSPARTATPSNGYAAFMFNFMSKSSRRAVSQIATTAGCLSFLSAEMA